jgi:hypothetical protein
MAVSGRYPSPRGPTQPLMTIGERSVQALVEDQGRLDTAVRQEELTADLRQPIPVLRHRLELL